MESSIDMQIHRLGMSADCLERTTDWWESFIKQSALTPTHWDNAISQSLSHRLTYAYVTHPSPHDISYDVISMGRRQLSYSDSPQSHNTTSNTHKPHHSTLLALLSSIHSPCPPPHHSSLSFLPWHQPGSVHELHLHRTISWSVAPQMT